MEKNRTEYSMAEQGAGSLPSELVGQIMATQMLQPFIQQWCRTCRGPAQYLTSIIRNATVSCWG